MTREAERTVSLTCHCFPSGYAGKDAVALGRRLSFRSLLYNLYLLTCMVEGCCVASYQPAKPVQTKLFCLYVFLLSASKVSQFVQYLQAQSHIASLEDIDTDLSASGSILCACLTSFRVSMFGVLNHVEVYRLAVLQLSYI